VSLKVQPNGLLGGLQGPRTVHLDIVDYPGEWLLDLALRSYIDSFWGLSLAGSILLISMGAQLYRWRKGVRFAWVRVPLASLLGVLGFGVLFIALVGMAPITSWGVRDIAGPLLLDTIAIAYLVPAGVLAVLVWKLIISTGTCVQRLWASVLSWVLPILP